jgi:cell division protein FtsQ
MTTRRGGRGSTAHLPTAPGRRGPTIRRASAASNRVRAVAALVIVVCVVALYGLTASSAFAYRRLALTGATYTPEAEVTGAIRAELGRNLFTLSTGGMAERLRSLTTVRDASVEVTLPDTLRVRLEERVPIVVWVVGDARFLIDKDRNAFARDDGTKGLPVIDDRRVASSALFIGSQVDAVDFDAATRLASLRPADVGSGAAALGVTVDDDQGYVLDSGKDGWKATFGFYTPTIRRTDLIPGQVRLLRSLLAGREAKVATILLADERNGTFTEKTAP